MSFKGLEIQINGQAFTGFTDMSVSRSFMNAAGQFTFTAIPTGTDINTPKVFPVQVGNSCVITAEGQTFLTGYVEDFQVDQDASSYVINISGRDRTMDLIDSTIDSATLTQSSGNTTLKQICETVIAKMEIQDLGVVDNVTGTLDVEFDPSQQTFTANPASLIFSVGELVSSLPGQGGFDFLQQYAHYKQTILSTDGKGNLTINRTGTVQVSTPLLMVIGGTNNNIVKVSTKASIKNQFNFYKVYSQKSLMYFELQGTKFAKDSADLQNSVVNQIGESTNTTIRKGRKYIFISETPLIGNLNADSYANWLNTYRQTQGFACQITVYEHTFDGTNIWQPNTLVQVNIDTPPTKIDSVLLIDAVTFIDNLREGRQTVLTLVWQNAYSLEIEQNYREAAANVVYNPLGIFFNTFTGGVASG